MRLALHAALVRLQNHAFAAWLLNKDPRGSFHEVRTYYTFRLIGKLREAAYRALRVRL